MYMADMDQIESGCLPDVLPACVSRWLPFATLVVPESVKLRGTWTIVTGGETHRQCGCALLPCTSLSVASCIWHVQQLCTTGQLTVS